MICPKFLWSNLPQRIKESKAILMFIFLAFVFFSMRVYKTNLSCIITQYSIELKFFCGFIYNFNTLLCVAFDSLFFNIMLAFLT